MKQRILTAIVLAVVVVSVLLVGPPVALWLLAFAVTIYCGTELRDLVRCGSGLGFGLYSAAMLWAVFSALKLCHLPPLQVTIAFCGLFLVGVMGSWASGTAPSRWIFALLAPLWITMPFACSLLLSDCYAESGFWRTHPPLLLTFLPVWGGDVAAIFVGKAFGKNKIAPEISPKKTVEGSLGHLAAAVLIASVAGPATGYALVPSLLCGFAIGVFGQLGDLFESALKRRASMKDSGWILPGHGGLLDRIDSLLFAAPVVTLILLAFR